MCFPAAVLVPAIVGIAQAGLSAVQSIGAYSAERQAAKESENVSITVNLNSDIGDNNLLSVTNPTGLNTSPRLNEYPCLEILNDDTPK
jgi:hypothetical protein